MTENILLKKSNLLKSVAEMHEIIEEFNLMSKKQNLFLGITGSFLSRQYKQGMDIDLVFIIPDKVFLSEKEFLPNNFSLDYQRKAVETGVLNKLDVMGSYYNSNSAIRLEIYKESSAKKILNQTTFTIHRFKEVPKNNKVELFFNSKGNVICKKLNKLGDLSKTFSFINRKNVLYWGMHYERLLLADGMVDSLLFNQTIKESRENFLQKVENHSEIQNLFYVSRNNKKIDIRKYLIS